MPDPPPWMHQAACRGMDPGLWFPEGQGASTAAGVEVCEACPVRVDCADWAIAEGFEHGTFGGMTAAARRPQLDERYAPSVEPDSRCACGCGREARRRLSDACQKRAERERGAA